MGVSKRYCSTKHAAPPPITTGGFVVTGTLNLRYRRPCPVGKPLVVTARILADEGRFLRIEGTLRLADSVEAVTVAEGKFYPNPERASEPVRD